MRGLALLFSFAIVLSPITSAAKPKPAPAPTNASLLLELLKDKTKTVADLNALLDTHPVAPDVLIFDTDGFYGEHLTAMHAAIELKRMDMFDALYERAGKPSVNDMINPKSKTTLYEKVLAYGDWASITRFRSMGGVVPNGETELQVAAASNTPEVLDRLLTEKPETLEQSSDGFAPLHMAAAFNKAPAVEFLLQKKASVEGKSPDMTPLAVTMTLGRFENTEVLLRYGANPLLKNQKNMTPFDSLWSFAGNNGHKEILDVLARLNIPLPETTTDGESVLIESVKNGASPAFVTQMIAMNPALPRLLNKDGESALVGVCQPFTKRDDNKVIEVAKVLIAAGASVHNVDNKGYPFMNKCTDVSIPILQYLKSQGADPTLSTSNAVSACDIWWMLGEKKKARALRCPPQTSVIIGIPAPRHCNEWGICT